MAKPEPTLRDALKALTAANLNKIADGVEELALSRAANTLRALNYEAQLATPGLEPVQIQELLYNIDECAKRSLDSCRIQTDITVRAAKEQLPAIHMIGIMQSALGDVLTEEYPAIDSVHVAARLGKVIDSKMSLPQNEGVRRLPSDDVAEMDSSVPIFETNGHKPTNGVA